MTNISYLALSRDLIRDLLTWVIDPDLAPVLSIASSINPGNHNNSSQNSDAMALGLTPPSPGIATFVAAMFCLQSGAIDSTIDFKLEESISGSSGWSDIPGKAITQETGGDDDDKQWIIFVSYRDLSAGRNYVRGVVTLGNGTTNIVGMQAIGLGPRVGDGETNDMASVSQRIGG